MHGDSMIPAWIVIVIACALFAVGQTVEWMHGSFWPEAGFLDE